MKLILGFDTETTGLTSEDRPVQIGAVLVNPVTWEVVDSWMSLVDPERDIHPDAEAIHGISRAQTIGQPTLQDIWERSTFANWVKEADVVFGHNIPFDAAQLGEANLVHLARLDTLTLVRRVYPKWRNHKLQSCVSQLSLPQRAAHDALGDIVSCVDVLKHINLQLGWSLEDMLFQTSNIKGYFKKLVGA